MTTADHAVSTTQNGNRPSTLDGQIVHDGLDAHGIVVKHHQDAAMLDVVQIGGDVVNGVLVSAVRVCSVEEFLDGCDNAADVVARALMAALAEKTRQANNALDADAEHQRELERVHSEYQDELIRLRSDVGLIRQAHADEKSRMRNRIVSHWNDGDGEVICTPGLRSFLREFDMDDIVVKRTAFIEVDVEVLASSERAADELIRAARITVEVDVNSDDENVAAVVDGNSIIIRRTE